jgi:hypothetical protein
MLKTKNIILKRHYAYFIPRSPALHPAGRTIVRSKCSLHFSALFAAKEKFIVVLF